ncbi:MAG: hypothetical protein RQ754_03610 [Desulfuromonadales bacterium]|nr:hypothetical protein [Desulfuromonadales bacterium]
MLYLVRHYAVPLALLLTIFVFAGTVSPATVMAADTTVNQCCDKEPPTQAPANEDECFNCGCLSCLAGFFMPAEPHASYSLISATYLGVLAEGHPSGFIRSIDYPPEFA